MLVIIFEVVNIEDFRNKIIKSWYNLIIVERLE
jgi:hypothetical protein